MLEPIRLAAIEGGRSPRLTGAQRLPVPPILRTDGGRRGRPFVHEAAGYAALAATLGLSAEALGQRVVDGGFRRGQELLDGFGDVGQGIERVPDLLVVDAGFDGVVGVVR